MCCQTGEVVLFAYVLSICMCIDSLSAVLERFLKALNSDFSPKKALEGLARSLACCRQ